MKRMFYAIAAVAIVSGALAFKANRFIPSTVYCVDPLHVPVGACPALDQTTLVEDASGLITTPCSGSLKPYINVGTTPQCTASAFSKFTDNF